GRERRSGGGGRAGVRGGRRGADAGAAAAAARPGAGPGPAGRHAPMGGAAASRRRHLGRLRLRRGDDCCAAYGRTSTVISGKPLKRDLSPLPLNDEPLRESLPVPACAPHHSSRRALISASISSTDRDGSPRAFRSAQICSRTVRRSLGPAVSSLTPTRPGGMVGFSSKVNVPSGWSVPRRVWVLLTSTTPLGRSFRLYHNGRSSMASSAHAPGPPDPCLTA